MQDSPLLFYMFVQHHPKSWLYCSIGSSRAHWSLREPCSLESLFSCTVYNSVFLKRHFVDIPPVSETYHQSPDSSAF
jgi:hypothetical protein